MTDNSREPGADPRFDLKSVKTREGADIGFLKHVFRVGIISHNYFCRFHPNMTGRISVTP